MKKYLNLAKPAESDILFEISKFPDGQQSLTLTRPDQVMGEEVTIVKSIHSFNDIEIVICANQALLNCEAKKVNFYSPYFLGARSDRKFNTGSAHYLKQVICPVINSQGFNRVIVMDPHSFVLEGCLNNFEPVNNFGLVKWVLTQIDNKDGAQDRIVLVSPDGGSLKKVYDVAEFFGIDNVVIAAKHRDIKSGRITHTEIPNISQYGENHKFVIVDDICDGGRTFVELAKEIRKHNTVSEIHLIVTHGIFSAGLLELSRHFTNVYSTNSYSDINPENFSDNTVAHDFLRQLNVFNTKTN